MIRALLIHFLETSSEICIGKRSSFRGSMYTEREDCCGGVEVVLRREPFGCVGYVKRYFGFRLVAATTSHSVG